VTGIPNSGKSEWLDALAVNLAAAQGWRFALCSLENDRLGHLVKLVEKRVGKPFYDGAGGRVKMSWEEAVAGWLWVDEMFHRIVPPPEQQLPTIDFVLERARILVLRCGCRGGRREAGAERAPGDATASRHPQLWRVCALPSACLTQCRPSVPARAKS
jgi:twinkle protein